MLSDKITTFIIQQAAKLGRKFESFQRHSVQNDAVGPTECQKKPPKRGGLLGARGIQVENDEPQPQVVVALGFLMTNCAPSSPSL